MVRPGYKHVRVTVPIVEDLAIYAACVLEYRVAPTIGNLQRLTLAGRVVLERAARQKLPKYSREIQALMDKISGDLETARAYKSKLSIESAIFRRFPIYKQSFFEV